MVLCHRVRTCSIVGGVVPILEMITLTNVLRPNARYTFHRKDVEIRLMYAGGGGE